VRHHYLVSYDIADPVRLRHVFKIVRDFGDRLQLSVFLCQLSERELALLRERLQDRINHAQDQVLFVRLAAVAEAEDLEGRVNHLGRAPDLPGNDPMVF
jgi:CRISPR-associated protein Cas2